MSIWHPNVKFSCLEHKLNENKKISLKILEMISNCYKLWGSLKIKSSFVCRLKTMEHNCRMCLEKDVNSDFTSFSFKLSDIDDLSVYECYTLFTSIILDNFEEQNNSRICVDCLKKLLLYYNDRNKAIENNKTMTKLSKDVVKGNY